MTVEAYLIAALAVVLTGISKSGFAGGLGVLGVPLISLVASPQLAAAVLLPILIGIDILSVWRYRNAMQPRMTLSLVPGAALGVGLGMVGFTAVNADWLRVGIGVMALLFAGLYFVRHTTGEVPKSGAVWVFIASLASGFASFVAHAGGPPMKGVLLRLNLEKSAFVGTNAFFFFLLNGSKGVAYAALGLFSQTSLGTSALLTPFLFVGVWIGFTLHNRVPQKTFTVIANVLLALAGLNLLAIGGQALLMS